MLGFKSTLLHSFLIVAALLPNAAKAEAGIDLQKCTAAIAKSNIVNFHEVVPGKIYRGSRPKNINDIETLNKACGIEIVLNLQGGDPWYFNPLPPLLAFERGELGKVRREENRESELVMGNPEYNAKLNSFNKVTAKQEALIEASVMALENTMQFSNSVPVYVHCEHGVDRTGLVVALFKVMYLGVPPNEALDEMISFGHSKSAPVLGKFVSHCEKRPEGLRCVNKAMVDYFKLATTEPMGLDKIRKSKRLKKA